ncbi:hypothetical protein DQM68_16015 [Leptospira mayottensis]|uniref:Uncharacterized protein n=2 Tax=Leptospira mayottensis TaxID=1137606 RepID=A0AA87SYX2_9LEPT|nr:hypothetical protein DQM68_16015 [Leptospira mayottensis]AXR65868.1 hypothetical protein DQM28_18350 [Leptospira mayottensis]AZQ01594.1 hypothetical protein LEP1GSC190_05705 [Leptospira mayottensis 200901116]EKS01852.1 hypothetical protein LEP1GSC125_4061 [Leptospira mayottensis 200901122]TGN17918.1 hypothetical protein EHR03_00485 [Leptospira mayottensis]
MERAKKGKREWRTLFFIIIKIFGFSLNERIASKVSLGIKLNIVTYIPSEKLFQFSQMDSFLIDRYLQ